MDQLKRMAVFAEVVAAGSLTAAARRLDMTPSAVSQHLRQSVAAIKVPRSFFDRTFQVPLRRRQVALMTRQHAQHIVRLRMSALIG